MIRMALLALGFLAITVALVMMQPGASDRLAQPQLPAAEVTRAEPSITPAVVDQGLVSGIPSFAPALPTPEAAPASPQPRIAQNVDDQEMRQMTWQTLSSLNQATGQEKAPGQPGSLLHTIVRRSLSEAPGEVYVPSAGSQQQRVYVVQKGDTLVSIAERVYGDVNMTVPLILANQSVLERPDDLRPGQRLFLPE